MMKDYVLWQYNLIDCHQNETHLPTCTNTWDYLFIHFIPVFSLSFILSTCLCSSPQRRRRLPSIRVWSLSASLWRSYRRNALPKGEWLATCNYPSLSFLFFIPRSLPSSPVVLHLSNITVMGSSMEYSFVLSFFWERFGRLDGQLKQTEGLLDIFVFSHPHELHCVTISRLYCASADRFDMTQRVTHSGLTSEIMLLYDWWYSSNSCLKHRCQALGNAAINIAIICYFVHFAFLIFFF